MAAVNQTGIFYATTPTATIGAFPVAYRKRMLSGVDRRFTILFIGLMVIFGTFVGVISFISPSTVVSEKEVLKMQERYAQLVLNEPKPQPKAEAVKAEKTVEGTSTEAVKEEAVKVDRAKETFVEKEKRREASVEQRKATREAISKKIASAGIFAAITATKGRGGAGGSGAGGGMSDLLGASDAVSSLDGISVSKGTFATRNVSSEELKARKAGGGAAGGGVDVGIEARSVGKAQVAQIASNAAVSISSEPAEVKGDETQVSTNRTCIQRVITRESTRIKRVYEDWLKRDPQLGGRIKIKLTIMPGGSVSNAGVAQSTTNNESFDQAIIRYIQRWDFSSCNITSPLDLIVPFAFEGQS